MHYRIENSPEANIDIQNAIDYFLTIGIHLVYKFRDDLDNTYNKIKANPEFYKYFSHKKYKKNKYRCLRLKKFRYLVIYKIDGNKIIVTAVFNTYRRPIHGQA